MEQNRFVDRLESSRESRENLGAVLDK